MGKVREEERWELEYLQRLYEIELRLRPIPEPCGVWVLKSVVDCYKNRVSVTRGKEGLGKLVTILSWLEQVSFKESQVATELCMGKWGTVAADRQEEEPHNGDGLMVHCHWYCLSSAVEINRYIVVGKSGKTGRIPEEIQSLTACIHRSQHLYIMQTHIIVGSYRRNALSDCRFSSCRLSPRCIYLSTSFCVTNHFVSPAPLARPSSARTCGQDWLARLQVYWLRKMITREINKGEKCYIYGKCQKEFIKWCDCRKWI